MDTAACHHQGSRSIHANIAAFLIASITSHRPIQPPRLSRPAVMYSLYSYSNIHRSTQEPRQSQDQYSPCTHFPFGRQTPFPRLRNWEPSCTSFHITPPSLFHAGDESLASKHQIATAKSHKMPVLTLAIAPRPRSVRLIAAHSPWLICLSAATLAPPSSTSPSSKRPYLLLSHALDTRFDHDNMHWPICLSMAADPGLDNAPGAK